MTKLLKAQLNLLINSPFLKIPVTNSRSPMLRDQIKTLHVSQFCMNLIKASRIILANFAEIRYALNTFQDYFTLIETDHGVDVVVNFKSEDKYFDYDSDVKKYELSVYLTDYPDDPTGGRKWSTEF